MERTVSAADDGVLRLAMWSGPRNLSTAFMRSWENRDDTIVVDEPFYAHYLTGHGPRSPWPRRNHRAPRYGLASCGRLAAGPGAVERPGPLPEADVAPPAAAHGARVARLGDTCLPDPRPVGDARVARREARELRPAGHGPAAAGRDLRTRDRDAPARCRPCSTPPTCSTRPSRCCVRCVRRSGCRSPIACCGGRPGGANRTVSGPGTGTTGSSNRPASRRHHRQRLRAPRRLRLPPAVAEIEARCRPLYDRLRAHRLRA